MAGAQEVTLLPGEVEASEVTLAGVRHGELLPKTKCDTIGVFAHLGDESRLAVGLPVYRRVELLGRGAFGKAYLVEAMTGLTGHPESKPQRVLKKMPLQGVNADQREAAFREALVMRKICRGCPFITQFSEVFLGKGGAMLCLVMEYCAGGDLRNLLRNREGARLPEEEVLSLAAQVGLALHHCHAHGVLHRDVKPENCFLRSVDGDLLLGDFGISCSLDDKSFAKTCVGSPLYMSPEIVNQDRYSFATDVWSLAVMVYEAAMLAPPFKGSNICQVAFRIVTTTPEPLDREHYSEPFRQLVERLLVKDPLLRPSVAEALQMAPLDAVAAPLSLAHGLVWPPPARSAEATDGIGRRGLVQRLRGHVAGSGPVVVEAIPECDESTVALDDAAEEAYGDDFEEASESDASYEADFEQPSDDGGEQEEEPTAAAMEELTEEQIRQRIRAELGDAALAAAEAVGIVSFLDGVGSAGRPLAVQ